MFLVNFVNKVMHEKVLVVMFFCGIKFIISSLHFRFIGLVTVT